jgi:hypothetical protein
MAGVGNVDLRRKTNYLIVDSSMFLKFECLFSLSMHLYLNMGYANLQFHD